MKTTLITIIAVAALSCNAAFAERVDIGGYFSFDLPRIWHVELSGRHVNVIDTYAVYAGKSSDFAAVVHVQNNGDPTEITYARYAAMTEQDLPELARFNAPTGWTITKVRKDTLNGIPVLYFNEKQNGANVYKLSAHLWIQDKHFYIVFFYPLQGAKSVNAFLDSVRAEALPANYTAQSVIGDF
jgi:hypothetical protein